MGGCGGGAGGDARDFLLTLLSQVCDDVLTHTTMLMCWVVLCLLVSNE